MRVLSIYRPTKLQPPTQKLYEEMGAFMAEAVAAGVLLATEGIGASTPQDLRVRLDDGKYVVTDGPFTETKELIAGFWILQVRSMDEAIEWIKRAPNPMPGESDVEIRPVFEAEDFGEAFTPEARELEDRLRQQMAEQQK